MLAALSPLVSLSDMTGPNADTKETDTMKTDISRFFTVCYIFFGTFFFAICLSLYSDMMFAMRESLDDHASEHASKRDADEIEGSTAHERRHRKTMKDSKIKVACTWVKNHLLSGGKRFILIIFAVLCVVGGTVFGVVVEGWTVIQALYFAVTAMSTGGMQAPNKDTPGVFLSAQNTQSFLFFFFRVCTHDVRIRACPHLVFPCSCAL